MNIYKNASFTKRNYECQQTVYCQANSKPVGKINWVECNEIIPENIQLLYIQDDVSYYGYL